MLFKRQSILTIVLCLHFAGFTQSQDLVLNYPDRDRHFFQPLPGTGNTYYCRLESDRSITYVFSDASPDSIPEAPAVDLVVPDSALYALKWIDPVTGGLLKTAIRQSVYERPYWKLTPALGFFDSLLIIHIDKDLDHNDKGVMMKHVNGFWQWFRSRSTLLDTLGFSSAAGTISVDASSPDFLTISIQDATASDTLKLSGADGAALPETAVFGWQSTDPVFRLIYQAEEKIESGITAEVRFDGETIHLSEEVIFNQSSCWDTLRIHLNESKNYPAGAKELSAAGFLIENPRSSSGKADLKIKEVLFGIEGITGGNPEATITVVDRASGEPVYRAEVSYKDVVQLTSPEGQAFIPGIYEAPWIINISHQDYFPETDSLMISADTVISIQVTRKLADLRFIVSDSTGFVPNQPVFLAGMRSVTDSHGEAWYFNIPARQVYGYSVEKDGCLPVTDSFFLETDTTVQISLEQATGMHHLPSSGFQLFPNPVIDYVDFITDAQTVQLSLSDINGRIILHRRADRGRTRLNLSGQDPGIYFLRIRSGDQVCHKKIVIRNAY